jgi:hypothetical protein
MRIYPLLSLFSLELSLVISFNLPYCLRDAPQTTVTLPTLFQRARPAADRPLHQPWKTAAPRLLLWPVVLLRMRGRAQGAGDASLRPLLLPEVPGQGREPAMPEVRSSSSSSWQWSRQWPWCAEGRHNFLQSFATVVTVLFSVLLSYTITLLTCVPDP